MSDAEDIETTPIGFVEETLGVSLYDWQAQAIAPLEFADWGRPIVQISLLAPNEAGKSKHVVAPAAMYFATVCRGKVGITTKDQKQLNEQVIPALEEQLHKFGHLRSVRSPYYRVFDKENNTRIMAYVTDDAGRVEGLHGSPECPLLQIVDEAKSVPETIFQAIDRCGYQALLYCSSGGLMQGTFYGSQTKNRDMFHVVTAGLKDCPHISPDKVKRIIDKWGERHPFTRSCVYGEFMEQDDWVQFIFPHSMVKFALENPPQHRPGMRLGFCDFAEGIAEHVLAVRDGNKTDIALAFREADKHAAAARFIRAFVSSGLKAHEIWGDAADKELLDILSGLGWQINRQNFGAKARNDEQYVSWSAEAWHETAIMLSKGEIVVPNDEILIAQLTSRQKTWVGRGKQGAEEKYDMRKRGIESPDRADAYCGCQNVFVIQQNQKDWDRSDFEDDNAVEHSVLADIGAYAGYQDFMLQKYKLIKTDSVDNEGDIEELVNAELRDGWHLHGPTQLAIVPDTRARSQHRTIIVQALSKGLKND